MLPAASPLGLFLHLFLNTGSAAVVSAIEIYTLLSLCSSSFWALLRSNRIRFIGQGTRRFKAERRSKCRYRSLSHAGP